MKRLFFFFLILLALIIACSRAYTKKFVLIEEVIDNNFEGWTFEFYIFAFIDKVWNYEELDLQDSYHFWIEAKYLKDSKNTNLTDIHMDTLLYMTMIPGNEKYSWKLDKEFLAYSCNEYDVKAFTF